MPPKRPHPNPFGEDDAGSNGDATAATPSPKRPRIIPATLEAGSSGAAPPASSGSSTAPSSVQAQIAAAKAKIMAKMASQGQQASVQPARPPAPTSASLPPRPSASMAGAAPVPPRTGGASAKPDFEAMKRRVAEAKRAAEEKAAAEARQRQQSSTSAATRAAPTPAARSEGRQGQGLHPLLAQQSIPAAGTSSPVPSYARGAKASATPEPIKVNPYLSTEDDASAGPSSTGAAKRSMHRPLQFNRAGRHVAAAEEARREAQLEALQKRIAERGRLAGLSDKLTGKERAIKRQPPPDVEWWDAALLPEESYECVPAYPPTQEILARAAQAAPAAESSSPSSSSSSLLPLIISAGTPIDSYVQHPIPIPAPSSTAPPPPSRGIMLTKREMKKMRRQRRAAEQQDKQDRIKMGLQAPDAPKVKLSNLMRVLTSEAVADPTKVEARVRREVAARRVQHERTNAERALTGDQRWEKEQSRKERVEEQRGTWLAAWAVPLLAHPYHLATIKRSAKEQGLGGRCVRVRPGKGGIIEREGEDHRGGESTKEEQGFSLVVVEGSFDGIKKFKKTMAKLSERDPRDKVGGSSSRDDDEAGPSAFSSSNRPFLGAMGDAPPPGPTNALDDLGLHDWEEVTWSRNTFQLVHEGRVKERLLPPARAGAADGSGGSGDSAGYALRIVPGWMEGSNEAKEQLPEQWRGLWDVAGRWVEAEGD
ncbi:PRP3-domain-containing protein [Jaminaea rosea]|uniref:PRP3-domain-containing protein n=1 Tax=Jaminaea rosea TaxID=1569628 RepID=A0A316USM7_9BASI|nr:PRP3-domain-containing protein [Jaminaea rosea]PWN26883.1 PRP3-domain-containing protein [Jaminaea rosea]